MADNGRGWRIAALLLALALAGRPARAQQIALTFDDLPVHSALPPGQTRVGVMRDIIAALRNAGVPEAYGFVNGLPAERDTGAAPGLDLWVAAGFPVANHTWSHLRLTAASDWLADVERNEPLLQRLQPRGDWRWLRYPFLAEGETAEVRSAARDSLRRRGYKIASVTLSFDDWAFNEPYARCMARGDSAAVLDLERRWLAAAAASLDYESGLSRQLYGRDIPFVLLLHVGALDARMLPRLLEQYRAHGVQFVTLAQAEADPFYRDEVAANATPAPATLSNAMAARGLPVPPKTWRIDDLGAVCR